VTLQDLAKLSKHMADHPLEGRTEAGALQRIGDVFTCCHQVEESHKSFLKAESVLIRFMNNNPNEPVGPRNLAAATNTLGDVELRLGETMKARDRYAKALALRQQWLKMLNASVKQEEKNAVPVATLTIAESHDLLGRVYLELGDPAEAYKNFQKSDAIYSGLPPIGGRKRATETAPAIGSKSATKSPSAFIGWASRPSPRRPIGQFLRSAKPCSRLTRILHTT